MRRTFDEMDRLFDWMTIPVEDRLWGGLEIDLTDYDDEFVVTVDLPGVERGDIDLAIDDGILTITAERTVKRDDDGGTYLRRERQSESASRRVALPAAVIEEDASANYTNGVLTVSLPKETSDEGEDSHHIEIQ